MTELHGRFPHQPQGQQGEVLTLSTLEASKVIRGRKLSHLLLYHIGGGMREGSTCTIEVRMAAAGGAVPKRPVSLAWGKEGMDWEVDSPETHESLGCYLVILRKHQHLVLPTSKTNINPGDQRNCLLSCSPLIAWDPQSDGALACSLHGPHGLSSHVGP